MHVFLTIWDYLVSIGLYRDLLAMLIGSLGVLLPWRRHRNAQKDIADKLNTKTPGGLRDVAVLMKAQIAQTEEVKEKLGGLKEQSSDGSES